MGVNLHGWKRGLKSKKNVYYIKHPQRPHTTICWDDRKLHVMLFVDNKPIDTFPNVTLALEYFRGNYR